MYKTKHKSRIPKHRLDNVPFDHQLKDLAPFVGMVISSPDVQILVLSYCKPQYLRLECDEKTLIVDLEYKLYMTITPDLIAIYIMGIGYLYITDMWIYLLVKEGEGLELENSNLLDWRLQILGKKTLYLDSKSGIYYCDFARPEIRFRTGGVIYSTSYMKPLDLPSMADDIRILNDALYAPCGA